MYFFCRHNTHTLFFCQTADDLSQPYVYIIPSRLTFINSRDLKTFRCQWRKPSSHAVMLCTHTIQGCLSKLYGTWMVASAAVSQTSPRYACNVITCCELLTKTCAVTEPICFYFCTWTSCVSWQHSGKCVCSSYTSSPKLLNGFLLNMIYWR